MARVYDGPRHGEQSESGVGPETAVDQLGVKLAAGREFGVIGKYPAYVVRVRTGQPAARKTGAEVTA